MAVLDAPVMLKAGWDKMCDAPCSSIVLAANGWPGLKKRGWSEAEFNSREAARRVVRPETTTGQFCPEIPEIPAIFRLRLNAAGMPSLANRAKRTASQTGRWIGCPRGLPSWCSISHLFAHALQHFSIASLHAPQVRRGIGSSCRLRRLPIQKCCFRRNNTRLLS